MDWQSSGGRNHVTQQKTGGPQASQQLQLPVCDTLLLRGGRGRDGLRVCMYV
jgi:hypothetical protein